MLALQVSRETAAAAPCLGALNEPISVSEGVARETRTRVGAWARGRSAWARELYPYDTKQGSIRRPVRQHCPSGLIPNYKSRRLKRAIGTSPARTWQLAAKKSSYARASGP
jgi:hypothetical protein